MSLSVRLFRNRILAASYRAEGIRLLQILKRQMGINDLDSNTLRHTLADGTRIMARSIFGQDVIEIDSPPTYGEEGAEERKLYYLRFGMLQSILVPAHTYQLFKVNGRALPPVSIKEMPLDGTSRKYLQVPYWLKDNRKHKRSDSGDIIPFSGLPSGSFGGGTPDVPERGFNWIPYEVPANFDTWTELLARQAPSFSEDASGWLVDHGVYTYDWTRAYTHTWTDALGGHSTLSFVVDHRLADDDVDIVGTYPASLHQEGTSNCSRTLQYIAGSDADFDGETMDLYNPAIGNHKLKRICYDVTLAEADSFVADWTVTSPGVNDLDATLTRDILRSGTAKLFVGDTEVDSGAWSYATDYDGSLSGTHWDAQPPMTLFRDIAGADPSPFHVLSAHFYATHWEMADLGSDTVHETTLETGNQVLFRILNFANVEDHRFAICYKKATRVHNTSLTDGVSGGDRVTTNEYYLAVRSAAGVDKTLLGSHTITETLNPYSLVKAGSRVDGPFFCINKRFILYAYVLQTFSGGAWANDSYHFGVIGIGGGQRVDYSYTPGEMVPGGGTPFDNFMFIPRERELQP